MIKVGIVSTLDVGMMMDDDAQLDDSIGSIDASDGWPPHGTFCHIQKIKMTIAH